MEAGADVRRARLQWVPGEGVRAGEHPPEGGSVTTGSAQTRLPLQEPKVGAGTLLIDIPAEKANPEAPWESHATLLG